MNNFAKNVKKLREYNNLSMTEMAKKIGVNHSTLSRWESESNGVTIDNALDVAAFFNVTLGDLVSDNLELDSLQRIDENSIKIPVLGTIKAGTPIEAQEDIIEYIDIPKDWTKGNKKFYALKISGDSMTPKYLPGDIVVFEHTEDSSYANGKDCVILVNGYDATFKKFTLNENGVILTPHNMDNSDHYPITFYSKRDVENLPVRIIGIAVEKRTRL